MPLHSVPLCSFKYVGDVYTKALFDYNFSCNIFKTKSKYVDKVENKIYKRQSKIISKNAKDIKKNDIKIVLKENGILDKSKGKCLSTLYKSISINNS